MDKTLLFDTPWILGIDVEKSNNRALSRAYTIKTYGGNVHTTYLWNEYVKYDIHYRARHSSIDIRGEKKTISYARILIALVLFRRSGSRSSLTRQIAPDAPLLDYALVSSMN